MDHVAALKHELDVFDKARTQFAQMSKRTDDGSKRSLIALRRDAAAHINEIRRLGALVFAQDAELLATFESKFGTMRSAMAVHQASWPASSANLDNPDFRASVAKVEQADVEFFKWLRTTLVNFEARGGRA